MVLLAGGKWQVLSAGVFFLLLEKKGEGGGQVLVLVGC